MTIEEMIEYLSSEKGETVKEIVVNIMEGMCSFSIDIDDVEYFNLFENDCLIVEMKKTENVRINLNNTNTHVFMFNDSNEQIFLNVKCKTEVIN